jgi:ankyrin repeat protein
MLRRFARPRSLTSLGLNPFPLMQKFKFATLTTQAPQPKPEPKPKPKFQNKLAKTRVRTMSTHQIGARFQSTHAAAETKEIKQNLTLHEIAREGNVESLQKMIRELGIEKVSQLASSVDNNHYTPLHLAAKHNTPEFVSMLLALLGNQAATVSKVVTDDGKLPISLGYSNPHCIGSYSTFMRMLSLLMPATRKHQIPDLSAKLNVAAFIRQFPEGALKENLTYAAIANNQARRALHASSTHPQNNSLSPAEFEKLGEELNQQRIAQYTDSHHLTAEQFHQRAVSLARASKKGNCGEFAHVVVDELKALGVKLPIEIVRVAKGDHVFVVLGRDPNSDLNDYRTWGNSAVCIDAWGMDQPFVANDIPKYLKSYLFYDQTGFPLANISATYNPKFHKLERQYLFQPVEQNGRVDYKVTRFGMTASVIEVKPEETPTIRKTF